MTSNNIKNDVKSLLALLSSSSPNNAGPSNTQGSGTAYSPSRPGFGNPRDPRQPQVSSPSRQTPSVIPTKRQLDDLLASLSGSGPAGPSSLSASSASRQASQAPSAFSGPRDRHSLIQPFGPVGATTRSEQTFDPQANYYASSHEPKPEQVRRTSSETGPGAGPGAGPGSSAVAKSEVRVEKDRKKQDDPAYAEMGIVKALPIISSLMEDVEFRKELKKMKADQDALERRLWAKQEKVKAEHEKVIQAEKDIARISQKPIPRSKQQQWEDMLASDLAEFYLQTCLPSIDGLSLRQREKLQELGVPGLGGDIGHVKTRDRVKKIMDILEVALDE